MKPLNNYLSLLALGFTVLVWGVAPAIIRSFSLAAGAADALVIRSVATGICCVVLLPFCGGFAVARQDIPRLLLISLIGMFGYFAGSVFGFSYITSAIGGIVISTQPLLIALLASAIGAERVTVPTIIGLIVSFIGSLYLFSGDAQGNLSHASMITGGLLIFMSGAFWAVYVIYSKSLIQSYGSVKLSLLSLAIATLPALVFISPSTWETTINLDRNAILSLFYLTFIGTLVTLGTWNYAVGLLRPTAVGASLYLIPIFAITAGTLLLGEIVSATTLIAGAIILLGVAIAQFGPVLLRYRPQSSV
ncbi:MAG: DMT family transporter [Aestuariivirga sp.]